ncbi:glycosyltransferase BC10 isoform X2 [Musa acuminata AAA Group]|uniref:glycosyltransferase BC10-like isoform X2 n=1 Tax=Musa acuminata AAA Group TaxID=214697 RepID=UPI0031D0ABDE
MTAMKKRASPPTLWLGLQLILWLSVLACTLALIGIGSRSPSPAALVEVPFSGTPKIAFLFLARSNLPLDFLWHAFFQNAEEDKYSIYVHSEPGFVFDRTTTRSPFFFGRQIQDSIKVVWGEATMIEAERLLFAAALKDPANRRFALISDSFLDKREGRYNPKMFPTIPKDRWRKGSQWTILVRKHAQIVVADTVVFPEFRRFCKRRIEPVLGGKQNHKEAAQKEHNCIPDEHYMQTLLSMNQLEDELERRTLTYTSWNQSIDAQEKNNWHPKKFEFADASLQHITEIRNINHIYYETEYRTEWCQCNATFVPCFLFARKFSRSAAMRILKEGLIGPFDAGAVLFTSS